MPDPGAEVPVPRPPLNLPLDEFKSLPGERQSEEVFKLLNLLSPFATQVQVDSSEGCSIKSVFV